MGEGTCIGWRQVLIKPGVLQLCPQCQHWEETSFPGLGESGRGGADAPSWSTIEMPPQGSLRG